MLLKKRGKEVAGFLLAQGSGWRANPTYVVEDVPTIYGLEAMVANILNIIIGVAGVVLLLMLIGGGFSYIIRGSYVCRYFWNNSRSGSINIKRGKAW